MRMRVRNVLSVCCVLVLFIGLAFVAVTLTSGPAKLPVPVQQTGTAAGRPHRVSASAMTGRMVNGRFVPDASKPANGMTGPVAENASSAREVPGAVPPAVKPKPVKLPARGKVAPESVTVLKAPAPARKTGYNAKTSRELAPVSSNQVTYANADGTKTAFRFQDPVNYRLPDGRWATISTNLVPAGQQDTRSGAASAASPAAPSATSPLVSADAWFSTPMAATPSSSPSATVTPVPSPSMVPASPSGSPASSSPAPSASSASSAASSGWREQAVANPEFFAARGNAADLVVMPVDGSHSVAFGISGAEPVTGSASGNTVTYADVRPGSSAVFSADTGMVDEKLVLSSPSAPASWVFPLDLKGLRAQMGPGGIVQFADAAGQVVAYVPHGFMSDSNINPHSGDGATSDGVTYSLTTVDGRQAIKMTLDTAWLDDKARVWPVTVDPTVTDKGTNGTTYVQYPYTSDYSSQPEIHVGTYDGGSDKAESYLSFGDVASELKNDTVLGARLGVFNTWSYSCSPRTVYVYPVTSSWSVTGSKSWPGPSTGGAVGRATFATGWVPLGSTSSPCPASWEGINLDQAGTNLLNGWTHGTVADNGLALGASTSDSSAWKKFASHSTGNPFLAITYTPDGASYKLASSHPVTDVTPGQNGKIAIRVTNTGSSTWDANNANGYEISYRAYNSAGGLTANHPVFTPMPSTVAPGQSVTVDVTVDSLGAGTWALDFDMYSGMNGGTETSFSSQGIAPYAMGLYVYEPPPTVTTVYPQSGSVSTTLRQQLSTTATGDGTLTYDFTLTCEPVAGQTCVQSSVTSGSISKPYWTPPLADMSWNVQYEWSVVVTATSNGISTPTPVGPMALEAQVPQPGITSGLGGSSQQAYDPLSGNYTTSATDAAVKAVGPPLEIDRTYNSLDPRSSGAFGAGWSTVADTSLRDDTTTASTVTVTLPSGQQMRFGENGDGTYAAPFGSPDALKGSSSASWLLRDSGGNRYAFTGAGQLTSITNVNGYEQDFTYDSANQLAAITDSISGRALTLTWSTPSGASYPHVVSVTTPASAPGDAAYSWSYSYAGDELTQVCAPAATGSGCTQYSYGSGSQYRSAVLDANPRAYWQLGDLSGTDASDEVDVNLGTADGTYSSSVTLANEGPLAGSEETSASFHDNASLSLPNSLISDGTDVSVGLWFETTGGGVLFSYDADALSSSKGNSDHHTPALYVGTNGELYGEFWNGSVDPVHTSASVADGKWHYAVLSAASTTQTLYLDGQPVGTLSGQIDQMNQGIDTVGAGFWQSWPEVTTAAVGYFTGGIGQVAVYPQPLSGETVASQYALATTASPELEQVTLPSGNTYEQAAYDSHTDRLATYTDPHGGQWTIDEPLTTGAKPTSESVGRVIDNVHVTDPAGDQVTYSYDMLDGGRLAGYDNGADPLEVYGYDAAGFLTTVEDQEGNLVCLTNDAHGNVLTRSWYTTQSATLPGLSTGANPSACGGSTVSGPNCTAPGTLGGCTTFYGYYYNDANPLDPQNDELLTVRDGRSASATDSTYETKYAYDNIGQLISSTTPATSDFPNGRTTVYGYTTGTEPAPDGGTEPYGMLSSQTTPGGAKTSYAYDSNGDLAQVTEPSGRYTTYAYDGLGRATSSTVHTSTYPSGETTTYSYTPTGQQSVVTYPSVTNKVTNATHQLVDTYTYDADNDVTALIQTDAVGNDPERTTSYTYDDHDQVATVTQPAGATTGGGSQSDGAASANPTGATTGYTYDGFGDVTQVTDPNGNQYRYTYNEYQEPTQEILYTSPQNASSSTASCVSPAVQDSDGGCDLTLKSYAYGPSGLLAATTDVIGRITNYFYDSDQELTGASTTQACSASAPCTSMGPCTPTAQCTTGSAGISIGYTYDGAGNVTSQAVSDTRSSHAVSTTTTNYSYDAANRLASKVDDASPSGTSSSSGYQNRTTAYTYNGDDQVLSKTTGTGDALDVTDYSYDTAGDKLSQTVQDGSTSLKTSWTYDQNGLPLSETSPRGNASGATASDYTTSYGYDPNGNLVTRTDPPVAVSTFTAQTPSTTRSVTQYGYDTFGDQTQVQDPDGNVSTTAFDGDGRETSVEQAAYTPPGASATITKPTAYAYDEDGNVASVTDPAGNVTSYGYDALGDVTSVTQPQLPGQSGPGTWTYGYDAAGEQTSATDPLGNKTQKIYDYFGNVSASKDALGNTTAYAYDYLGDQTQVTTPDGVTTTSAYDGLGELTSQADGAGDTSTFDYDDQGNLAHAYNPDGSFAEYGYDGAGQLTSVADYPVVPAGQAAMPTRSESFGYDADGDQTSVKDWDGNTTQYAYDATGDLTSQVVPVSSSSSITTSYGYDAAGNRTSVTGGNKNTTWTTYNSWNLPQSVVEPTIAAAPSTADTTWTTAYDADGRPVSGSEPGGVSLSYGYDPLGDITSESGSGASASTPARSFTYDLDGRMSSASAPGGADSFGYDPDSLLKNTSGPSGTSSYAYNADDLIASETDAAGTTSYTYDNADRLSTESEPLTGSTLTYQYNADSNPTSVSYASGGSAGPKESFGYDSLQRLTSDTVTSASGAVLASEGYGYDSNGNLTSQTTGGDLPGTSVRYGYDEANRLTSAVANGSTVSYGYDGDGNLVTDGPVSDTYNAQDQLTSSAGGSGTTSYAYSLNGDLASVTAPSGPAQDYGFDAYGDLASVPGGVSYGYDALGRLTTRTSSSGTASMSYLGTGPALASDGTSDYSYAPSGEMTATESSYGAFTTMSDVHGDLTAMFSPTSTAEGLAGYQAYTPYGAGTKANYNAEDIGYQGDYTDPATGLVEMGARWYNPATGTFTSADTLDGSPVPSTVDGNPYAYADGNPLTNTDPTGHSECNEDLGCSAETYAEDIGNEKADHANDQMRDEAAEREAEEREADEENSRAEQEDREELDELKNEFNEHLLEEEIDAGAGASGIAYEGYEGSASGAEGAEEETAPPPPPQDKYESGAEKAPSPPKALANDPEITADPTVTQDKVDPGEIPDSQRIVENSDDDANANAKAPQGSTEPISQETQQAQADDTAKGTSSDDSTLTGDPVSEDGKPATPRADNGAGGGGPPGSSSEATGGSSSSNPARFIVDSNGAITGIVEEPVAEDDRLSWADQSEILRYASEGKGNFGLGSARSSEAEALGRAWVGEGYRISNDGKTLISQDEMRQFRPPSYKPNLGIYQANFEQRVPGQVTRQWFSNGHLDITDLP